MLTMRFDLRINCLTGAIPMFLGLVSNGFEDNWSFVQKGLFHILNRFTLLGLYTIFSYYLGPVPDTQYNINGSFSVAPIGHCHGMIKLSNPLKSIDLVPYSNLILTLPLEKKTKSSSTIKNKIKICNGSSKKVYSIIIKTI